MLSEYFTNAKPPGKKGTPSRDVVGVCLCLMLATGISGLNSELNYLRSLGFGTFVIVCLYFVAFCHLFWVEALRLSKSPCKNEEKVRHFWAVVMLLQFIRQKE